MLVNKVSLEVVVNHMYDGSKERWYKYEAYTSRRIFNRYQCINI